MPTVWRAALAMLPAGSLAAGSSGFAQHIKSLHELIVDGDRPEISACLYSAELVVGKSPTFERIRWTGRNLDESVVREYRLGTDWVRETELEASALLHGAGFFSIRHWIGVRVECRQVNGEAPQVTLRVEPQK